MSNKHRSGYQYPASRLRLLRGKWHVIISIPAHMRHLYNGTQRDKRKSTFTSDEGAAQRLHHSIAQRIYDEFDQKQEDHLTKHHVAADNFAADAIYGLATSFSYKNVPDLRPSTNYDQLVALKNSCDVYADMIMNGGTVDEVKLMADFLLTSPSAEVLVAKFRETQAGSAFTIVIEGVCRSLYKSNCSYILAGLIAVSSTSAEATRATHRTVQGC